MTMLTGFSARGAASVAVGGEPALAGTPPTSARADVAETPAGATCAGVAQASSPAQRTPASRQTRRRRARRIVEGEAVRAPASSRVEPPRPIVARPAGLPTLAIGPKVAPVVRR